MNESVKPEVRSVHVLSIDGGGFRGLSCLLILQHLMNEIVAGTDDADEPPRPCEVFDLICGTSTGGLIAILLGRLGLSCDEAISVYRDLGPVIFGKDADSGMIWGNILNGERFSAAHFGKQLEKIVTSYAGNKDALMKPLKNKPDKLAHKSAPTFVTVVPQIGSAGVDAYRIRSYARPPDTVDSAPSGHKWTIFEAARGTSAAPSYFSPLDIRAGDTTYTFQDAGGSGFNNPAKIAMDEAQKKFGEDAKITLISLGTGLRSLVPEEKLKSGTREVKTEDIDNLATGILANIKRTAKNMRDVSQVAKRLAKQLIQVATDTEMSHSHVFQQFTREGVRENYYRFNPPQGLGGLALWDYKQEAVISSITDAWLKSPDGRKTVPAATSMRPHYQAEQEKKEEEKLLL